MVTQRRLLFCFAIAEISCIGNCSAFVIAPTSSVINQQRCSFLPSSSDNLNDDFVDRRTKLPNGTTAQIISSVSSSSSSWSSSTPEDDNDRSPPLLFVHGSFHAAWCWSEHYLPYFRARGHRDVHALSLRGTAGTPAGEGVTRVTVEQHVDDLAACVDHLTNDEGRSTPPQPPVLISHSFGGLVVLKYLETRRPSLSGAAFLCSVPPSGNGKMTMRFLRRSLVDSWKITAGLALKKCLTDDRLCRRLFFDSRNDDDDDHDERLSDEDVARYQSYFARDVAATIDLGDLARKLPSKSADERGRAVFAGNLPPVLVVGAKDDFIVDEEGVRETAVYLNTEAVQVDSPHDVMLGPKWRNGAEALSTWLEKEVVGREG